MRLRKVLAALPMLAMIACGSAATNSESAEERPDAAASTVTATPAPSDVEPVFVPTADGGQLDFNSLRGQDFMLCFWAPW